MAPDFFGSFAIHDKVDRYVSGSLVEKGCWEPFETQCLHHLVRRGDVVLDAGANIGWYSTLFARWVGPSGAVHAFEPDADNFALLSDNVARLAPGGAVTLYQQALGNQDGTDRLYLSSDNLGDHHLFNDDPVRASVLISVRRLDTIFRSKERWPDILKSDTQGSEARLIQGAERMLKEGWRPLMLLEYWPYGLAQQQSGSQAFLGNLERLGYQFFELNEWAATLRPTNPELLQFYDEECKRDINAHTNLIAVQRNDSRLSSVLSLLTP